MYSLTRPTANLFDWHATLVNTLKAMYLAVDDVFLQFERLDLLDHLVQPAASKTIDDAKLVNYVKIHHQLHPKLKAEQKVSRTDLFEVLFGPDEDAKLVEYVRDRRQLHPKLKADRKISRTDIFEVLFGDDEEAKKIAHNVFNRCYRNHFGEGHPFESGVRDMLVELCAMNIKIGVLSNRDREFLDHELKLIEDGSWADLFATVVGGDSTENRKPAPDPIEQALENLDERPGLHCWYVGDSSTDTVAAKAAGVTSIFYNGAKWEPHWIAKIFPGTREHPHQPNYVVNNFNEFLSMVMRHGAPNEHYET